MESFNIFQKIATAIITIAASFALIKVQKSITFGEILLITVISSLFAAGLKCFIKAPRQFARAMLERILYLICVPICTILLIAIIVVRMCFILIKLSMKGIIAIALWLIYLLSPIDLIPDIMPFIGMIDDVLLFMTIGIWIVSASFTEGLRTSIKVFRPTTPFP